MRRANGPLHRSREAVPADMHVANYIPCPHKRLTKDYTNSSLALGPNGMHGKGEAGVYSQPHEAVTNRNFFLCSHSISIPSDASALVIIEMNIKMLSL
jgi:hypothetical protein